MTPRSKEPSVSRLVAPFQVGGFRRRVGVIAVGVLLLRHVVGEPPFSSGRLSPPRWAWLRPRSCCRGMLAGSRAISSGRPSPSRWAWLRPGSCCCGESSSSRSSSGGGCRRRGGRGCGRDLVAVGSWPRAALFQVADCRRRGGRGCGRDLVSAGSWPRAAHLQGGGCRRRGGRGCGRDLVVVACCPQPVFFKWAAVAVALGVFAVGILLLWGVWDGAPVAAAFTRVGGATRVETALEASRFWLTPPRYVVKTRTDSSQIMLGAAQCAIVHDAPLLFTSRDLKRKRRVNAIINDWRNIRKQERAPRLNVIHIESQSGVKGCVGKRHRAYVGRLSTLEVLQLPRTRPQVRVRQTLDMSSSSQPPSNQGTCRTSPSDWRSPRI